MTRRSLTAEIDLHTLRWDSFVYPGGGEGGGPTVGPYLWTGFFKMELPCSALGRRISRS